MNNDFTPYFCGGVLFSFLIELHNDTAAEFKNTLNTKKIITQPQIMEALIRVINPDYSYNNQDTFQKTVSEYRTCKSGGGKIIPFERDLIKTEFNKSVTEEYEDVLERMNAFTERCFPTSKNNAIHALVQRTLMVIRDDKSIPDDTLFFININKNRHSISKKDLLEQENFNFQSFLVGMWHYVITQPTKNICGRETFEKIFSKHDGKNWAFISNSLEPYTHSINVTPNKASEESPLKGSYDCETITKEKLTIKIYYKGTLLQSEEEKAILSADPAIIDLNEHPDIFIENNPNSIIYRITTDFEFKTLFLPSRERIVRLHCNVDSLNISGTTSIEKWISKSKLNEMCFHKKYPCTAWFTLTSLDEEYSAEFLLIGKIIK